MKINEVFHSIQGEGATIGLPTVFVRLTGCNLRCNWCDTQYAYDEGEEMDIPRVLGEIRRYDCKRVCITGGEPLLQEEAYRLMDELLYDDFIVVLETNGSVNLERLECSPNLLISMDIKCPGSGESEKMDFSNIELLGPTDQLKFIITGREDYDYAKYIIKKYEPQCLLVMTPSGGTDLKQLAEWVLGDHLNVAVLPQLHKIIWGNQRGK